MKTRGLAAKNLDDFELMEIIELLTGWNPPICDFDRSRSRWHTLDAYLVDFDSVRDELLASDVAKAILAPGEEPGPVRIRRELAENPGEVYQKHFHCNLVHPHVYRVGDKHIHDDQAWLGAAIEVEARMRKYAGGSEGSRQ
jgi:hypothetical protein